jgi:zinc protease
VIGSKKSIAWVGLLAIFAGAPAGADDEVPEKPPHRRWQDLSLPPLRPFSAPKPERRVIDGIAVYLLEDHELPVIDLVALVRVGEVYETREKAGLASICGEVMRSGGTAEKPGDRIDEELESMGASVEVGIDLWQGRASVSALRENFPAALETCVKVLEQPAFPEEKIDLAKRQRKSAIARRNDEPQGIASREFRRAIYGDDSPYGWTEEVATIDAVTREDLVEFHKRWFRRERTIIGVVGDFETDDMAALIERAFADYGRGEPVASPPEPPVRERVEPKVYLVQKPDINQSTVILGHLGIRRRADDPDYFAAVVANAILGGGGFSSRLPQIVRTDLGLAYSVFSHLDAPYSHRGTFFMECQTKSESTIRAAEAMKKELARMVAAPPSAEELRIAKESILQSLVFASASRRDVIERALRYEYYGFPQDYLEKFQAGIAAVTEADVLRAARKLFHPESLVTMIVGNEAAFDKKAETLGPTEAIDVSRPAWPKGGAASAAAADPAAHDKAAKIAALAVEAHGGKAALEAVRAVRTRGAIALSAPGQPPMTIQSEQLVLFPKKIKRTLVTPMGIFTECFDGEKAWAATPGGVEDTGPGAAAKHEQEIRRDLTRTLLDLLADPGALEGEVDLAGKKALAVVAGGRKLYFDPESHLLVGKEDEGVRLILSDHRKVGGVLFPFKWSGEQRGMSVEATIEEIAVNPEIPSDAFARPKSGAGTPAPKPQPAGAGAGK